MVVLDPQAAAVLDAMTALGNPPLEECTPELAREIRRSRLEPSAVAVHETRAIDAGGVPARLYRPSGADGLGLLVYLHGGGWVIGDLDTHDATCRGLAVASRHAVLSVDYRLAPEHPFPAPLDDALSAAAWARANAVELGCDPDLLAVGGDSAGGNLAAVVAQSAIVPLRFQLLVYPITDARCGTSSYREFAKGPFLTRPAMRWYIDHYLSGEEGSPDDARVSPLLGDDAALSASPPTLVLTVASDVLRDEGEAYAARLASVGVPTEHRRYDGMFHGFFALPEVLDVGREAVNFAGATVGRAFDSR